MYARMFLILCVAAALAAGAAAQDRLRAGNVALDIGRRSADSLLFSSLNVGLFGNVDTLRGAQLNLATSVTRREMRGVSIGGISAISRGKSYGVMVGGVLSAADGSLRGLQLAGVANMGKSVNGVQIAGLSNTATSPFRGVQLSAITNVAMGVRRGVQIAGAANVCSSYMRGLQTAVYNYADTLSGSQIGLVNVCVSHPRGVQVGLINYSRDTIAHKIGLVNINPLTTADVMLYGGSATKINMALRFRNRSTYSIIGVGTHYMGLDEDFSGALYYRIGQYFSLGRGFSISGDVGFAHIETFGHDAGKPERLYSVAARINLDYAIGRTLGAFVTAGYGDTRYYYHSHRYRHRPIFEAGLTLNYNKKTSSGR